MATFIIRFIFAHFCWISFAFLVLKGGEGMCIKKIKISVMLACSTKHPWFLSTTAKIGTWPLKWLGSSTRHHQTFLWHYVPHVEWCMIVASSSTSLFFYGLSVFLRDGLRIWSEWKELFALWRNLRLHGNQDQGWDKRMWRGKHVVMTVPYTWVFGQ